MFWQTFFRIRPKDQQLATSASTEPDDGDDNDEEGAKRGVQYRQFIKEKLMGHRIWHDGSYWEQALWQCALEQVFLDVFNFDSDFVTCAIFSCIQSRMRSHGMNWTRMDETNLSEESTMLYLAKSWPSLTQ